MLSVSWSLRNAVLFRNVSMSMLACKVRLIVLMLLLAINAGPTFAADKLDKAWHWVSAKSLSDQWDVKEGYGTVMFNGNEFVARLYDSVDRSLVFSVKGKISGRKVAGTLTTLDSDVGEGELTGTYIKKRWKGFSTSGRETIILNNEFNMLGLTRELEN